MADADAGVWEAADLQWWWRTRRASDTIDQVFWIDDQGPVAGVVLTDWRRVWGCDLIVVPGATVVPVSTLWGRAVEEIDALGLEAVEVLVDGALRTLGPHPMRHRNGEEVEARLRQCSLYDPELDLAVSAADGQVVGYALFWFDPVTKVGLVEPLRV